MSANGGQDCSELVLHLVNEFASIRLTKETGRCGVRVKITDTETQSSTYLDPLELAGLCEWDDRGHLLAAAPPIYQEGVGPR